jgi:hypothetical protein
MNRFQTLLSNSACAATPWLVYSERVETARVYVRDNTMAGRCRLNRVETSVESAWFHRFKLEYDAPLSKFAFNFNVRRYTMVGVYALLLFGGELKVDHEKGRLTMDGWAEFNAPARIGVGRCRLTVSKPELKARLVSALETNM